MSPIYKILVALALMLAVSGPAMAATQVDINHADAKALADGLSGIGLAKAEAIVAYRTEHGPFKNVQQLGKVQGIGKKTLERNRDVIVLGDAPVAAAPAIAEDAAES